MHSTNVNEAINPSTWARRHFGARCGDVRTHAAWRKIWKRNGGRKIKTLRTHRTGK